MEVNGVLSLDGYQPEIFPTEHGIKGITTTNCVYIPGEKSFLDLFLGLRS